MELERGKYYYIPILQAPSKPGTAGRLFVIAYPPLMKAMSDGLQLDIDILINTWFSSGMGKDLCSNFMLSMARNMLALYLCGKNSFDMEERLRRLAFLLNVKKNSITSNSQQ